VNLWRSCALLLIAGSLSGCSAFAISGGVGIGVGADLRVSGLLHTGAIAWFGFEGGSVYGRSPSLFNLLAALAFPHFEDSSFKGTAFEHRCLGLLPGLLSEGEHHHPWAFEVNVAAVFFHLKLGWDPAAALGLYDPSEAPSPVAEESTVEEEEPLERD